jgi:transcriptional regulator with XRE-family HTH domain
MENEPLGHQLRALRTAAGRTVASVAADAGLSVPYIANLENGRGNPTLTALGRLAGALGCELAVTLAPAAGSGPGAPGPPEVPASLVRFARTARFRHAAGVMAAARGLGQPELGRRLIPALAALASALGADLSDTDWGRILDALLLTAAHPEGEPRGR